MTTLHILSQSPQQSNCFERCLSSIKENDTLLLIENAVYAATKIKQTKGFEIYTIEEDVKIRGLQNKIHPTIKLISYAQFVELSIQHPLSIHWK